MTLDEIRRRFTVLGYGVYLNTRDPLWGMVKYRTAPLASGGSNGLFQKKNELIKYLEQVEFMRGLEQ